MTVEFKTKPDSKEALNKILNPLVSQWFFSRFREFSLPQLFAVSEVHSRSNVLVSAPTGATKTLTGFLSILNELVDNAERGILEDKVYCVYVSPLKALNEDIKVNLVQPLKEINSIAGKDLGIRVAVRTGDTSAYEKSKMAVRPPHILITTPESLAIVLTTKKLIEHLRHVEWVIVDEVHALAENKRGVHLSLSLERLQNLTGYLARVGLSATISPLDEIAKFLVGFENGKPRPCKIVDVQFIKNMDMKVISPLPDLIDTSYREMSNSMYNLLNDLIQSHRTTLIFTNTRAATERVVDNLKEKFPGNYNRTFTDDDQIPDQADTSKAIGTHHSSLSKRKRHTIEQQLREGKLKACVSSTSLELGIDIGFIDLVILLGSPKSVARAIQRVGRAGHQLHATAKGRLVVLDRDDLVECAVLLKSALEKNIDRIHIPTNSLDVLAQQIYGIAIQDKTQVDELFRMVTQSYCYRNLSYKDFIQIIEYLAGRFISLEDRSIYAKIWYDENEKMIGRKGKLSRMIYMTNIGTIPDEIFITVKQGETVIGKIDEGFLERLKRGDVFVLGGERYEFLYARGTIAYVKSSIDRPPTIPSWFSEMLPLSFDLAMGIGRFRRLMEEKFNRNVKKEEIISFINDYLYVDANSANAVYEYFREQFLYAEIPHDRKILIEYYSTRDRKYAIFHTLFGRRVNDCLSRAVAFAIGRTEHVDVEIGITDNGFYVASTKHFNALKAFKLLKSDKFDLVLNTAIDRTEVLSRRFRHCAGRSLMILRNYMGRQKRVGRQQVSSMILMNAVKRISPDFPILKEARREVLEDLMDIASAKLVLQNIEEGSIKLKTIETSIPSPFAFNLVLESSLDVLKMEEKIEFLKRMHAMVKAKIGKSHDI